jgi:hypothetical protein
MSMQKMAIPGKIVLDVGLFIGWVEGVRKKKEAVSGKKEAAS